MDSNLRIEVEREDDGRWITKVLDLLGVLAYGQTRQEAIAKAQSLSPRVMAVRLEHSQGVPCVTSLVSVLAGTLAVHENPRLFL